MKPRLCGTVAGKQLAVCLFIAGATFAGTADSSFVNFETAPVHPIALSQDGHTLAVCNLPDGRIELFDVSNGIPVANGNVPVGIDPVSLRFRSSNELWAVNFISSSVGVVDVAAKRVVATLGTFAGPSDVVFAGTPERAYVSCSRSNVVMVFDPITRAVVTNIAIDGELPRSLAISPDGSKVYVAIFESGNASTIATPQQLPAGQDELPPDLLLHPAGPYGGIVPPPNVGTNLFPPLFREPFAEENIPMFYDRSLPDSIILKRNGLGRWMDDNSGDWTEFISGTNAFITGRIPGWNMPDRDLAIIDTATLEVTYATGLMNICMNLAVNPASGKIAVVGTDATNERRFEPNLRGTFVRVNLALVDPLTQGKTILDLNPHLDYSTSSVPQNVRDLSLGDPRGIAWNSNGTRGFITGMGSRNLIVIDANGHRVTNAPVEVGDGPTGLMLDEPRQRIHVFNRFSANITTLDLVTLNVVTNTPVFDPTPASIRLGRKHLYDTHLNLGLGQVACGSCHVDARADRLAWDLGDPTTAAFLGNTGTGPEFFHPLKGPLITQTLQDIIVEGAPLHWRGDRAGIEKFDVTFTNLLGVEMLPGSNDIAEFKAFLSTISFSPNRFRNFDNSTPANLPLPGFYGRNPLTGAFDHTPLPNGNAARGNQTFAPVDNTSCTICHDTRGGAGVGADELHNGRGSIGIHKAAQLRSVTEKMGFDLTSTNSRTGFGLRFDGRSDSFARFAFSVFSLTNNQDIADTLAFVLTAFPSELPAAVGRQVTLAAPGSNAVSAVMLALAQSSTNSVELVARGVKDGTNRAWYYDRLLRRFQSDRNNEDISADALLSLAGPGQELTLTVVTEGTGRRIGIDRDEDGTFDRTELETGYDPSDPLSNGGNLPPRFIFPATNVIVHPGMPISVAFTAVDSNATQYLRYTLTHDTPPGAALNETNGTFTWTPSSEQSDRIYQIGVEVADDGSPIMKDRTLVIVKVVSLRAKSVVPQHDVINGVFVDYQSVPGQRYQLQFKDRLDASPWLDGPIRSSDGENAFFIDAPYPKTNTSQRFYRIIRLE